MKRKQKQLHSKGLVLLLIIALFAVQVSVYANTMNPTRQNQQDDLTLTGLGENTNTSDSWIVRWKGTPPAEFLEESELLSTYEDGIIVVKPKPGMNIEEWLQRWDQEQHVEYFIPNGKAVIARDADDTYRSVQRYLSQIRIEDAWDNYHSNTAIKIAIVDTGVDLDHPDLQDNLVKGYNLLDPDKSPQDDNGHGTNVAGVIASIGNNDAGTTGILWNAKIMPIKALDKHGAGEEDKLGEGIRYAVDHGCKIVVLSLGLLWYSPYLKDIVDYAEKSGVLLVAAVGNEGQAIKYPAAYPSVLAVGGIKSNNLIVRKSNTGPEIDLVAPWDVYTTALGGGYQYNQGTSMAAPQVAGVAALILAKYPKLKPYEVRDLLRQSAEDVGLEGWDPASGHGLLRADRALTTVYDEDMFEYNDTLADAKDLSVSSMHTASFDSGKDVDWYVVNSSYAGTLQLRVNNIQGSSGSITLSVTNATTQNYFARKDIEGETVSIPVNKGKTYLRIQPQKTSAKSSRYTITTGFTIYRDSFENNDKLYSAYTLPPRSHSIKGTFHQIEDEDWFEIQIEEEGTLQVKVSVNSTRMDPQLVIQRRGEKAIRLDRGNENEAEETEGMDVLPGKYYIQVSNVISNKSYPVTGEYTLSVSFARKLTDPNEPNNKSYQATTMSLQSSYYGLIDRSTDADWYKFTLKKESIVNLKINNIPDNRVMMLILMNGSQKPIGTYSNKLGQGNLFVPTMILDPGTYYVKLSSGGVFQNHLYRLTARSDELVAGFKDIDGHWAESAIAKMTKSGVIGGYGDYTFRPDGKLTRAEAVSMLVRALKLNVRGNITYRDVKRGHWAYHAISMASREGIVKGYETGKFMPDRVVSRAEMASMLANAYDLMQKYPGTTGFTDVGKKAWFAPALYSLKNRGLLEGYEDGTYHPFASATRAEFATLLMKVREY